MRDLPEIYFKNSKVAYQNSKLSSKNYQSHYKDKKIKPVLVKHLGRYRIPPVFPYLLAEVAMLGFETVDFISSNPWDFSDELIDVIACNKNYNKNHSSARPIR